MDLAATDRQLTGSLDFALWTSWERARKIPADRVNRVRQTVAGRMNALLSLRLDRSERVTPRSLVAGLLTRSLRAEGLGGVTRRRSTPAGSFATAPEPRTALITRQRRAQGSGSSPTESHPRG